MKRLKLIVLLVLAVLAIVVVLQNMQTVETRLLFATVSMPRAVLLAVTLLIGFSCGVLTALVIVNRKRGE